MYGCFLLTPSEFYELSVQDVNEMIESYREIKQAERWEQAYWTHCIMSAMVKRPPAPKALMKYFLPETKKQNNIDFFEDFERQRKEEENGG